jgi:zinc transporter 2
MEKKTRLQLAVCLSALFLLVEICGGLISNSLAVLSDACHLFTDIAGFGIALLATNLSEIPGNKNYTYGLARAEVFGAFFSVVTLWIVTIVLVYNAYLRALLWFEGNAVPVNGCLMFIIACFGVAVNICLGLVSSYIVQCNR